MAQGKLAVYAALAGNAAVMISKGVAAAASGSSSLFAEALHSLADTSDSALLIYGEKRSKRPPDDLHPFGHGRELYFWSMVVALMIFMIGGAASVVEGIARARNPGELESPVPNYIVLGAAFVFESITGAIAFRQFQKGMRPGEGYWEAFRTAKDPTTFMVLFEDSAALAGLVIAFLGVFLSHQLNMPSLDGIASIVIGLLLMTIAAFLCVEVKKLLIGERVDKELSDSLRKLAESQPSIAEVCELKTIHHAPEDVLVLYLVRFKSEVRAGETVHAASQIEQAVKQHHRSVKSVYVALAGE